jgi:hypothetical protein
MIREKIIKRAPAKCDWLLGDQFVLLYTMLLQVLVRKVLFIGTGTERGGKKR